MLLTQIVGMKVPLTPGKAAGHALLRVDNINT